MKPILYSTILATLTVTSFAAPGATAPGIALKAEAKPGDEAWAAIEGILVGPKKRPTSKEEAVEIYTAHLKDFDAKAASFRKDFPTDGRRWKLSLEEIKMNGMRKFVGQPERDEAAIAKLVADILAASDADKETKGFASFMSVGEMGDALENGKGTLAEFEKAVADHIKAYPDFKMNARLEASAKTQKTKAELKSKPFDLKFTATDGTEVDFAKLRGKVVLVDFWATWCGPCVAEVPSVVATYNKLHEKGFEIIGISLDQDKSKLDAFVKDKAMPWRQFFDGKGWQNEIAQKFGINSIPAMWLIDKKGMVVSTNAREGLAVKVEKALAE